MKRTRFTPQLPTKGPPRQLKGLLLAYITAGVLLGCSHEAHPSNNSDNHPVYRVVDIGKPGVPQLSKEQLAWVHAIERSPHYSKYIASLYFVPEPAFTKPLIVFLDSEPHGYHDDISTDICVIGDPSNDLFHGTKLGEGPIMDNVCNLPTVDVTQRAPLRR